jgi:short-subunit dehydrogenase
LYSASSGLGKALAHQLYMRGYNLILIAQNETMLQETKKEFLLSSFSSSSHPITTPATTHSTKRSHHHDNHQPAEQSDHHHQTNLWKRMEKWFHQLPSRQRTQPSTSATTSTTEKELINHHHNSRHTPSLSSSVSTEEEKSSLTLPSTIITTTTSPSLFPNNVPPTVSPITVKPRHIELIACDLSHPLAVFDIMRELKKRNLINSIDILIANAGKGHYGPVSRMSLTDIRQQLEVNVLSTVSLIRILTPRMIYRRWYLQQRHNHQSSHQLQQPLPPLSHVPPTPDINQLSPSNPALNDNHHSQHQNQNHQHHILSGADAHVHNSMGGRILIVSSVAGEGAGADIAIYAAAKAFLTNFASSLRRELLSEGILVSVAKPGPLTNTRFLAKISNIQHVPLSHRIPYM